MSKRNKLPKGWQMVPLSHALDVIESGKRPRGGAGSIEEGVPSIGGEHLTDEGEVVFSPQRYVPLEFYAKMSNGRIEKADVLIVKDGATTGKVALVKDSFGFEHAAVNEHVFRLRGKESLLLNEYLYYFLRSSVAQSQIKLSIQGSAQPGINTSFPSRVSIPFPLLPVQEQIVEVLQQADMIRRKRAEARRLADQILSSAFQKFFGMAKVKRKTLGSLLVGAPQYGTSEKANSLGDGYPVLRIPNVLSGELDTSDMKYIPGLTDKEKKKLLVAPGDILLVRTNGNRNYVGRCSVFPEIEQEFIFASYLMRLRPDSELVLPEYLDAFLRTQDARTQMLRNIPTSAGNYNINAKNLSQIEIPVPDDKDIQSRFVHMIEQQRIYSARALQSEEAGIALFQVLLSRAFTGELTAEWEVVNAAWIAERQTFCQRLSRLALLSLLLERSQRAGHEAVTLITALMKYAFLAQMEGELRRRFYRFVPYHYGPCAMELYNDLKALQSDGLIAVDNEADEDKTRITLTDPARAAALLEEEARKDDTRFAALEKAGEDTETAADPAMSRLLKRRAETLETIRADAATILNTYGNLDHSALLKTVYEKYPAYAKNSRIRKDRKYTSGK